MPLLQRLLPNPEPQDAAELLPEHLEGFKKSQKLAYRGVTAIERVLRPGMTEKEVTTLMDEWYRDHGVREYFHAPFAWFAERTAFGSHRTVVDFYPTKRRLEVGMPVILDVAPVVDGHASDIGYACRLGENPLHDRMLLDLESYRSVILDGVRARRNMSDIYRDVDRLIERQGYKNRHQQYPFRVLGHRVNYLAPGDRKGFTVGGFGTPALGYLFGRLEKARRAPAQTPLWNDGKQCARPADPGIWALEPHIGFRGIGVKWEELLVVTETDAYWLDDDLPHVRRFETLRTAKSARAGSKKMARPEVQQ